MAEKYRFNNLLEMIKLWSENSPKKKYIFFKDHKYTYAETYKKIKVIANALTQQGVRKGDRVVIFLNNSPEYIFSYFGILAAGAVAVPTNYFLKENELSINMNDCSASYIVTSQSFENIMKGIHRRVACLKKIFSFEDTSFDSVNLYSLYEDDTPPASFPEINDLAALIYTSGTTGVPKGVMLTHRNLLSNAKSFSIILNAKPSFRYVAALPLFHSYAFMVSIVGPLYDGSSVVILESVLEMQKSTYKKMLIFKRPSVFTGVPQIYSALSKKKISFFQRFLLPTKYYVSGGAPLPEDTVNSFKAAYGKPIIEGYGLSEAAPIVALNPLNFQKIGTVGKAIPGVDVKIVSESGETLPFDTPGELCCRGENIMKGYWNKPEDTVEVLKKGWLHTGDIAKMDSDGFITIVGRIKELIISKGLNVYPREIEEVLYRHESVTIAAVVGVSVADGDELIIAFIKPEDGCEVTEKELKTYARKNLANYKVPNYFVITNEIPVNASGKVVKMELKKIAENIYGGN